MEFETKEEYEKHINNLYVDNCPEFEFSGYRRPERHYIYPTFSAFEKEISPETFVSPIVYDFLNCSMVSAIVAQGDETPVEYLSMEQKLGICIGAGIPMKYENGKFITLYDVGIVVVDGKYKVLYKIPKLGNIYC